MNADMPANNDNTMWNLDRPARFASQASRYALTIAFHPDWNRIGATAYLDLGTQGANVCRSEPVFQLPHATATFTLDDRHISRKPVNIQQLNGRLLITPHPEGTEVRVDGFAVRTPTYVFEEKLQAGVVLEFSQRVILVLHSLSLDRNSSQMHRMLGVSEGIETVRRAVDRVADLDVPVLIRGETGTGKELVASALHNASLRAHKPMLAVNVGAIPDTLAIAELFGARKGSFTGSVKDKPGYFKQAHGSSLFLDEIGDAPDEVQVALLRTLETGEAWPVGSAEPFKVDVRVIAATDADLEQKMKTQDFRNPLLQRLAGFEIWLPPLACRRADVGLLLAEFLRFELSAIHEDRHWQQLTPDSESLWYGFFRHALDFGWPGNIRQMRNLARQVAIHNRLAANTRIPPRIDALLKMPPEQSAEPAWQEEIPAAQDQPHEPLAAPAIPRRKPRTIDPAELVEALEAQRWDLKNTADLLNISRAALYKLIDANPLVRKAGDISVEELTRCFHRCRGNLDRMVDELKVSKAALKRRINELAIGVSP